MAQVKNIFYNKELLLLTIVVNTKIHHNYGCLKYAEHMLTITIIMIIMIIYNR